MTEKLDITLSINGRDYPIRATVTQAIESEGVKGEAGAKESGKDLFPHQPQNPAEENREADRPGGPGDFSRLAG